MNIDLKTDCLKFRKTSRKNESNYKAKYFGLRKRIFDQYFLQHQAKVQHTKMGSLFHDAKVSNQS